MDGEDTATVVRVIDGDTFDADLQGKRTRIRLLNVDTPETKHPNKAVQCQGPEATRALTDLLPVGSTVKLGYDVERTDRYGRTLAGVTGPTGVFVNAELARLGLGVAVIFQPNVKWFGAVKEAQDEAAEERRGLFDPTIGCTVPAAQQAASRTVSTGAEDTVEAATATADRLTAEIARLEAIRSLLTRPPAGFIAAGLFSSSDLGSLIDRAKDRRTTATQRAQSLRAEKVAAAKRAETARIAAESQRQQEAARVAAAQETARQAAAAAQAEAGAQQAASAEAARQEAAAEAAREAARQAEVARQVQEQQRVAPGPPPAPAPEPPSPPAPEPPSGNPYPGYNGPRCYEPGGKVWRPCG